MITEEDQVQLRRCVELARQGLEGGNSPFGSLLAAADGTVLFEDHNRDAQGQRTRHPEIAIAYWAEENLSPEQRVETTVYTSGEHCPMCAAAHAWAGLGRIVYASSTAQLSEWLAEFQVVGAPTAPLSITQVAPGLEVLGPVPELAAEVKQLHQRYYRAGTRFPA